MKAWHGGNAHNATDEALLEGEVNAEVQPAVLSLVVSAGVPARQGKAKGRSVSQ